MFHCYFILLILLYSFVGKKKAYVKFYAENTGVIHQF